MAAGTGLYGSKLGQNIPRVSLAEFIGTYFLVLSGTAVAVAAILQVPIAGSAGDSLAVALSFGLALIVLVFGLGHISGCHLNPAVTLALAVTNKFPWKYTPFYILAQLAGACAAAATVLYMFSDPAKLQAKLGATYPANSIDAYTALVIEAIVTFLLVLIIMAIATDDRTPKAAAGTAVGFALAVSILIAGPLTGGAVNPARALGPMIVAGDFTAFWAYIIGPLSGGILAAIVYDGLLKGAEEPTEE